MDFISKYVFSYYDLGPRQRAGDREDFRGSAAYSGALVLNKKLPSATCMADALLFSHAGGLPP